LKEKEIERKRGKLKKKKFSFKIEVSYIIYLDSYMRQQDDRNERI